MMISTRGRYALRVLIDLCRNGGAGFISIKEVAKRQGISFKYLERIMQTLCQAGLVDSAPGRSGGYRLAIDAASCTVGEILRITEKTLAPVACLGKNGHECNRASSCPTLPMWKKFYELANTFFDGVSIADLVKNEEEHVALPSNPEDFTTNC